MRSNSWKALMAAVLVAALAVGAAAKTGAKKPAKPAAKVKIGAVCPKPPPKGTNAKAKPGAKPQPARAAARGLPRLVDLGSTKCIPCKMMVPVLEELARQYKGKLAVEFIDVWQHREAAARYKVQTIPTQIFYDARGKEFFRHIGFFPKEDILAEFKEHRIDLNRPAAGTASGQKTAPKHNAVKAKGAR